MEAEDVGIVVLDGGDALLFRQLVNRHEQVAVFGGKLVLLGSGCGGHPLTQRLVQVRSAAFEEHLRVPDRLGISIGRRQVLHAGAQTPADVVLEAGAGVVARQIDFAAGQKKAAVNKVDDAVGQVPGEVGTVVNAAVAAQAAGDEDLRPAITEGEFHVGVGLVVAQQDVEAGLALLDEIVFQSQRLVLVVDQDVVDVDRIAHQGAGFGVGLGGFQQVGADAGAQIPGFADVNHLAVGILIEVHAGPGG